MRQMIPKIIHYCWFGGNEKPDIIKKCIKSWERFCPDWEIVEWNETNFDVKAIPYMKEAYEMGKWAFVSDIARLLIVYHLGGVYMDTDVELKSSIDAWTMHNAFFVFETERNIATGLGFGAVKGHNVIKAMLDFYEGKHFVVNGKVKMIPCPAGNTEALASQYMEFVRNGITQEIDDVLILSCGDYSCKAFHYGTASWVDSYKKRKGVYKNSKIKIALRDYRIFNFIERWMGKKAVAIYTFIVYDLLEMGFAHYIRRGFSKLRRT